MGETQNRPFQLPFNTSLKVDFQGSRVTSDGGLIPVRELDEWLGFGGLIEQHLTDSPCEDEQSYSSQRTHLPMRQIRLYQEVRRHLGEVFRRLAKQKESEVEEGHLRPDHVHMIIATRPKYAVSQVIGYIKLRSLPGAFDLPLTVVAMETGLWIKTQLLTGKMAPVRHKPQPALSIRVQIL